MCVFCERVGVLFVVCVWVWECPVLRIFYQVLGKYLLNEGKDVIPSPTKLTV